MKIKTRMVIGFGTMIALAMILGGIAFWQSGIIWRNNEFLYKHPFKVNIAIREIQSHIHLMDRNLKTVVMAENQEQLNHAIHQIEVSESEVNRLFDTIYALYLGNRGSVDTALSAFRNWKLHRTEIIRVNKPGLEPESINLSNDPGEDHIGLINDKLKILKDFAMNRASTLYSSAEHRKDQLYLQLWFVLCIILISSVVIMAFIMRGITIPLRGLVSFAEKYGNGQYQVRNQYESTNELGVLAASMNKLAEAVQFDVEVKSGTMEIADTMLTYDDLKTFCESVLDIMLRKTKSNLGAFYFLNEPKGVFEPFVSCGFIEASLKTFAANSFEGDFGAVLRGKKTLSITHIPDDSAFVFLTVAGSIKPKEIVMIPVIRHKTVIAILSLANIKAYTPEAIEIMKHTEKNLNMSLNAVMAFDRIREYAESLDRQNELLSNQAKELQIQTGELVEQNTELEVQKRQIDEANRLKSQFLSSMSHELRTPLNSVIALSGVLSKNLRNQIPDEEYSYLDIIERNGKNLLALINDILDLSRIEAGKMDVQYEKISLPAVVDYILISLKTQIGEKSLQVNKLIASDLPPIFSDAAKCQQILQNLISNAVKFTDSGHVDISMNQVDGKLVVSVADTGIGIPADQLPYIFNEFRQVDGSTSRRYGGTGLGLAIVEKFAGMLGIKVKVESEPGKGSVFTLTFPAEALTGGATKPQAQSNGLEKYVTASSSKILTAAEAGEKTILIVEDSEPAVIQLSSILREQGYRLEIARNGSEALDAAKLHMPHAIILDLMMPGMDGFDVLEQIRGTIETKTIPVLILTAKILTTEELKRLSQNNIHQLVQKGAINKNELLFLVRQMLFPGRLKENSVKPNAGSHAKISSPAKVLIIDDNSDNVTTLKVLLGGIHTVFSEHNGIAGLEAIRRVKPDLVFLDISLPGLDGFKVFDMIRKDPDIKQIPIIAVTARAMNGDRERILEHGFDDYISKPIDPGLFDETMRGWFK